MATNHNRKIGIFWLIAPLCVLIIDLILYSISKFVLSVVISNTASNLVIVVGQMVNIVFGLLGIVAVIGIPLGIIVGIIYLTRSDLPPDAVYDNRSGNGDKSSIPPEINKWNWGAAGLGWIWGAYHRVWISFLVFVPIMNYVWWIVMGLKGNEWAWKKNRWVSVEDFLAKQKKWAPWGIVFFLLSIGVVVIPFVFGVIAGFIETIRRT